MSSARGSKIEQPITQEKKGFRQSWPIWAQQLPRIWFPPPDEAFQLISSEKLNEVLTGSGSDPESIKRLDEELKFLDHELLRLFRDRDYEAKYQQNRYRIYQLMYMVLAAVATIIGSLLALALSAQPDLVPWLAFGETFVALMTTYLASVSGREAPLPIWLENRRRAEHLRREYFRYLMNLTPYDNLDGYDRRRLLSLRAANINRGFFPDSENATSNSSAG
jgi:hypothetical protein